MKTSLKYMKATIGMRAFYFGMLMGGIGILLSSCMSDVAFGLRPTKNEGGEPVEISFGIDTRVAEPAADYASQDYDIVSLRVLLYDPLSGDLKYSFYFTGGEAPVMGKPYPGPQTIDIWTGTYDFVFITNSTVEKTLNDKLGTASEIDNISKLRALFFARSAAGAFNMEMDKYIPMVKLIEDVKVIGDETIQTLDMSEPQEGVWTVPVERVGIRLKLAITMTENQYADWTTKNVSIDGIANGAYILPGIDNSAMRSATATDFAASAIMDSSLGNIASPADGKVVVTYERLILPELMLTGANNKPTNGMSLSMTFGSKTKKGAIKVPENESDYSIPRNTFLAVNATVKEDELDMAAIVLPWNEVAENIIMDGQYALAVDKDVIELRGTGRMPGIVQAQTNYNITDQGFPKGLKVDNVDTQYTSGGSGWLIPIAWITGGNGQMAGSIKIKAEPNTTGATRTAKVHIKAGNMTKIINVSQTPMGILASPGVLGYTEDTRELTLRGSREYADNPDIAAAALEMFPEEGGLHEQTVYVAYYRWGTMVATGSENRGTFTAADIVAAPAEYDLEGLKASIGTQTAKAAWDKLPVLSGNEGTGGIPYQPENGIGDPCLAMTEGGGEWKMPTGYSWNKENGNPFGTSTNYVNWPLANGAHWVAASGELPAGAVGGDGTAEDWSMFLPAIGIRHAVGSGGTTPGQILTTWATSGHYWSSSPNGNVVSKLELSDTQVFPDGTSATNHGMGIRCVTLPPKGVRSVAGVIGYYGNGPKKGQLTLEGDNGDDRDVILVAYFKWGSLAAINQNTAAFTPADVLEMPTEYNAAPITNWASVPYRTVGVADANGWESDPENGLGDPCDYYFSGEDTWRLPTNAENQTYATGATVPAVTNPTPENPVWLMRGSEKLLPGAGASINGVSMQRGLAGAYWSSTAESSSAGYDMEFTATNNVTFPDVIYLQGAAVRCVIVPKVYTELVQAPPGVVGIRHSDLLALREGTITPDSGFDLTVAGSGGEYSTLPAAANNATTTAEFGTPETEPVYVVHFKWGSMVATIGNQDDKWSADDVVWVNPDFDVTITDTYASFSPATTTGTFGTGNNIASVPKSGFGDICTAIPGGSWHTPTLTEMNTLRSGATVRSSGSTSATNPSWLTKGGVDLLPAAGLRNEGTPYDVKIGAAGTYWTSTAASASVGYQLLFRNTGGSGTEMRINQSSAFACPIRCVATQPEYVRAVPGVIGYYANGDNEGQITLDGDDGDETDKVYVAYFKWGSLAAINQNTAAFTPADVLATPSEFDETSITNWASVPYTNGVIAANSWPSDPANGQGDPCAYYFGTDGWRMPTSTEFESSLSGAQVPAVTDPSPANPLWLTLNGVKLLPAAGIRNKDNGNVERRGTGAWYWYTEPAVPNIYGRMIIFGDVGYEVIKVYRTEASSNWQSATPIRCVNAPTPTITVTAPAKDFPYYGAIQNVTVESFAGDGTTPVAWETEYSTDGGETWSDTAPSASVYFPNDSGEGGVTTAQLTMMTMPNKVGNWADKALQAATPKGTSAYSVYDLSNNGGTTPMSTSNCYIVNAPGWYGIPRRIGNVYNDGGPSDMSFTYKGTEPAPDNVLTVFKDYKGDDITTDPLLSSSTSKTEVLWMDAPDLVTQVGVRAQYVSFYVDPATIKQGNAVITLCDPDGTIMWSWHIWVTPLVNAAAPTTKEVVSSSSFGSATFDFMEYNLGWVEESSTRYGTGTNYDQPRTVQVRISQTGISNPASTTFTITQTQGENRGPGTSTYYQWGRKDPFPAGVNSSTLETAAVYYPAGATATLATHAPAETLAEVISNPNLFFTNNEYSNYLNEAYVNLWDIDEVQAGGTAYGRPVNKTVYDPCPAGFSVPPGYAFSGFSTASVESWIDNGNNFYLDPNDHDKGTIYFPSAGQRNITTGAMTNTLSYYWSASPYMTQNTTPRPAGGYALYSDNGKVINNSPDNAAYGNPIRCVAE
jgi:hypothetical protein